MKIHIAKFKRIEDTTIKVPTHISGGNGLGKTTILEAIAFVLTGKGLDGKEFEQVYDNRQDLHEAKADVTFFDDYGNSWRRLVQPVFTDKRNGEEAIKTLRSTSCEKNGIGCNDFASEFADFYKYGADFFFKQKESDQRTMFIELMKQHLPAFDVNAAALKVKELKKAQKEAQNEIKAARELIKEVTPQEVPEIPSELQAAADEYTRLNELQVSQVEAIATIQAANKAKLEAHNTEYSKLVSRITLAKVGITDYEARAQTTEAAIMNERAKEYNELALNETANLEAEISTLRNELEELPYYSSVEDFANDFDLSKSEIAPNIQKLKELRNCTPEAAPEWLPTDGICALSGAFCEHVAKNAIDNEIARIKGENRAILERLRLETNAHFDRVKSKLENLEKILGDRLLENQKIIKINADGRRAFESAKTTEVARLTAVLTEQKSKFQNFKTELETADKEKCELKEPVYSNVPDDVRISEALKEKYKEFLEAKTQQTKVIGANEAMRELQKSKNELIKSKQAALFDIDKEITTLEAAISDYFSNLTGVVEREFLGKIKIGVELLEFVLTKNEYKDCFRITANGKAFPYECNGALVNNTKLQVLSTLQRLANYNGITVFDNAEANTTEPLETCGINVVVAQATEAKELSL